MRCSRHPYSPCRSLSRPFLAWWSAATLANLGDGIRLAIFPLLAAHLTDDPLAVGVVSAAGGIPWLVTCLLAGGLADRDAARRLLPLADAARVLGDAQLSGRELAPKGRCKHPVTSARLALRKPGREVCPLHLRADNWRGKPHEVGKVQAGTKTDPISSSSWALTACSLAHD